MHIAMLGPIATADVRHLLDDPGSALPTGYAGAPFMATLITELIRQGHRVSAITLSADLPLRRDGARRVLGPQFQLDLVPMRPRAWPFNGWRPGRIVDLYAFERAGLAHALAQTRPDVVHAHWCYEFGWAAVRSGLPHLVTCHDSPHHIAKAYRDLRHGGYRRLRAAMAWHVLQRAQHVSAVSPYLAIQVQGLARAPVDVVPNPLPPRALALKRSAVPGRYRVLMVCNGWSPFKNAACALEAFALLARTCPKAELVLLGQDFQAGGAASRWWNLRGLVGRVCFVGPVPHADALDWMARSDVLLHPSLEESFGLVIAEAMAIGLPVVAGRDSGAVPWLVGGDGDLVDVRSASAIAEALARVLRESPAIGRRMEDRRDVVRRRFGATEVAASYLDRYRRIGGAVTAGRTA